MRMNPQARAISLFRAENPQTRGLVGGWCSLLRTSLCKPNSLIIRENTGKFFDFGLNLGFARSETAAVADSFFGNSLKFGTGELILKNRDIFNNIRELNRAIRV